MQAFRKNFPQLLTIDCKLRPSIVRHLPRPQRAHCHGFRILHPKNLMSRKGGEQWGSWLSADLSEIFFQIKSSKSLETR
jgi:hypothetical protein